MLLRFLTIAASLLQGVCALAAPIGGYNLTEIGTHVYDASIDPAQKTEAQIVVDKLHDLGVRHVVLNPRAFMRDPRGSELTPVTPADQRSDERRRYARLISYVKSKGMTVGIRPIFFVVDANGNPYREILPDGTMKLWWHGNIQPADPNKWFDSFKTYLDSYLLIAKATQVEEFTIGAELYSMTVGIEDQWKAHPHGFPGRWLELLRYARSRLAPGTRVMYDINFTDDTAASTGIQASGGEFERWRYRLVDLANPANPDEAAIWQDLVQFWRELDMVGIDMYRSLASPSVAVPADQASLVRTLRETADRYASQIDNTLAEIEMVTGTPKKILFKEVGYKSVDRSFLNPFSWDESDPSVRLNTMHQAAAMEAFLQSFWGSGWEWMNGVVWWDVSVDPARHGANDKSFSPIGKEATESVLRSWFLPR